SHPILDRVPDQGLIIENKNVPADRIQATRGKDYLFVYTAAGKPFTVVMGKINGSSLSGYWFDPRTGNTTDLGSIANTGTKQFIPPSTGYGKDWVLVLDDAAKNYQLPK
ncbi:MAG: putative collagen-binding domain-containing protein, partial [Flavitalea sp.]